MEVETYDAIVVGSGQGGKPLSIALAKAGMKTAIIEREHIGGTCVNVGCIPKKLFVYASAFGEGFEDAAGFGWFVDSMPVFDTTLGSGAMDLLSAIGHEFGHLLGAGHEDGGLMVGTLAAGARTFSLLAFDHHDDRGALAARVRAAIERHHTGW